MSPWAKLLEQPHPRGHFVQLYSTEEGELIANVGRYLWEGLRRGEGVLSVVTAEHRRAFSDRLTQFGADVPALVRTRRLVFYDAHDTLARFMVGERPDWRRFEKIVREAMRQVQPAADSEGLRAYGEMVGLLWKRRQYAAAIRLEQLWNKLLEQSSFSLFCAYAIDLLGDDCPVANLEDVIGTHTHLVPTRRDDALESALQRSMNELLGPEAFEVLETIRTSFVPDWAVMPKAARMVLWLRKNLPHRAEEILRLARFHYRGINAGADGFIPPPLEPRS